MQFSKGEQMTVQEHLPPRYVRHLSKRGQREAVEMEADSGNLATSEILLASLSCSELALVEFLYGACFLFDQVLPVCGTA
jgi:hypothetical protein